MKFLNAKENEIEETIENASVKTVKESEKETNVIGNAAENRYNYLFSYYLILIKLIIFICCSTQINT